MKRKFLQREVSRHGREMFFVRMRRGGPRIRLQSEYGTDQFTAEYLAAITNFDAFEARIAANKARLADVEKSLRACVYRSRKRAKLRLMDFDLTYRWAVDYVRDNNYRCPVLGVDLCTQGPAGFRRPYWPSIDRIDSTAGYTKSNCRVVCVAANIMMNEWGEQIISAVRRCGPKRQFVPNNST